MHAARFKFALTAYLRRHYVSAQVCAGAALLSAGASMAQSAALPPPASDSQVILRTPSFVFLGLDPGIQSCLLKIHLESAVDKRTLVFVRTKRDCALAGQAAPAQARA